MTDIEPVFIDLETRSALDLTKVGGWKYAAHPSTHILTCAWSDAPDRYYIWYPWHPTIREDYSKAQGITARAFHGPDIPEPLREVTGRPWCAHNAWEFDELVWRHKCTDWQPCDWLDTSPLARAVGLPGGLDQIGIRLWGHGKYKAAGKVMKKHCVGRVHGDAVDVPPGIMPMLAEYNVQDVVLLRGVWDEVARWLSLPGEEQEVIRAHCAINAHGVKIDRGLLHALIALTEQGKAHAIEKIAELTRGGRVELRGEADLNSRARVIEWLESIGIPVRTTFKVTKTAGDGTKTVGVSLGKELVQRFIDANTASAEAEESVEDEVGELDETSEDDANTEALQLAVRVLQLRASALRITGGKLTAAAGAIGDDDHLRGWAVYAGAHTFRWAARKLQPHNLPRPKDGVKVWDYIDLFKREGKLDYTAVDEVLARTRASAARFRWLTPDDVASALIRSLFIPYSAGEFILAADYASIEARVLAHLAGDEGLMKTFWDQADPYIPMAEVMFGPWQSWPGCESGDYKTAKKHQYRQAGKIVRLGAGYQLGGTKMSVYAAANGVDLAANGTSGPEAILAYRRFHPKIAGTQAGDYNGVPYFRGGIWDQLNDAAKAACTNRGLDFEVGHGFRVRYVCDGPHLLCYMPSGRRMIYRDARVTQVQPKFLQGSERKIDAVVYTSARYGTTQMYGGKWTENVVQAISRDFLASALVRLETERPGCVALHVHDEVIASGQREHYERFMAQVSSAPIWAGNFPLDAEGGIAPRYSKSPPPGDDYREQVWRNGRFLKNA